MNTDSEDAYQRMADAARTDWVEDRRVQPEHLEVAGYAPSQGAGLLREAATKMRERAEAATPGPWWLDSYVEDGEETITDTILAPSSADAVARGADEVEELGSLYPPANATHAASWHPAVALAVADWLLTCASILQGDAAPGVKVATTHGAEAVALAYLGRPA